jgi:hypothetical protein
MSISLQEFREAWQQQVVLDRSLPDGTLRVAMAVSWHMNRDKHGLAWPGFGVLSKKSGMKRSAVIEATQRLEAMGHVTITRHKQHGVNSANRYQPILFDGRAMNTPPSLPQSTLPNTPQATSPSVPESKPEPLKEPPREPLKEPPSCKDAPYVASYMDRDLNRRNVAVRNGFAELGEILRKGVGREEREVRGSATSFTS